MRSACPPIMYGCKYLNFSRSNSDMELLARRTVQELEGTRGSSISRSTPTPPPSAARCMLKTICEKLGFDSLGYQSLDGLLEAIGIDRDKICTCWTGRVKTLQGGRCPAPVAPAHGAGGCPPMAGKQRRTPAN